MKAGKITAKLRDAVKICFMVEGEEVKRYKNIEMPDALKEIEILDFAFNVLTDGKIEFWLHFDQGILPEEWPRLRARRTRASKMKAEMSGTMEAVEAMDAEDTVKPPVEPVEMPQADIASAPVKRGRKPDSLFNKAQMNAIAL